MDSGCVVDGGQTIDRWMDKWWTDGWMGRYMDGGMMDRWWMGGWWMDASPTAMERLSGFKKLVNKVSRNLDQENLG